MVSPTDTITSSSDSASDSASAASSSSSSRHEGGVAVGTTLGSSSGPSAGVAGSNVATSMAPATGGAATIVASAVSTASVLTNSTSAAATSASSAVPRPTDILPSHPRVHMNLPTSHHLSHGHHSPGSHKRGGGRRNKRKRQASPSSSSENRRTPPPPGGSTTHHHRHRGGGGVFSSESSSSNSSSSPSCSSCSESEESDEDLAGEGGGESLASSSSPTAAVLASHDLHTEPSRSAAVGHHHGRSTPLLQHHEAQHGSQQEGKQEGNQTTQTKSQVARQSQGLQNTPAVQTTAHPHATATTGVPRQQQHLSSSSVAAGEQRGGLAAQRPHLQRKQHNQTAVQPTQILTTAQRPNATAQTTATQAQQQPQTQQNQFPRGVQKQPSSGTSVTPSPQQPQRQQIKQPDGWRVKLYRLNADGSWDDCGTGRIVCLFRPAGGGGKKEERGKHGLDEDALYEELGDPTLCMHAEIPSSAAAGAGGGGTNAGPTKPKVLLRTRILLRDAYQRQGDNIITWCEPFFGTPDGGGGGRGVGMSGNEGGGELHGQAGGGGAAGGVDLALSFQDNAGCLDIWRQITHIQSRAAEFFRTRNAGAEVLVSNEGGMAANANVDKGAEDMSGEMGASQPMMHHHRHGDHHGSGPTPQSQVNGGADGGDMTSHHAALAAHHHGLQQQQQHRQGGGGMWAAAANASSEGSSPMGGAVHQHHGIEGVNPSNVAAGGGEGGGGTLNASDTIPGSSAGGQLGSGNGAVGGATANSSVVVSNASATHTIHFDDVAGVVDDDDEECAEFREADAEAAAVSMAAAAAAAYGGGGAAGTSSAGTQSANHAAGAAADHHAQSGGSGGAQVPNPPTLNNLEEIADVIAGTASQVQNRDSLALLLANADCAYLKSLLSLFPLAEAKDDYRALATLAACIKTILLLNDPTIIELIVTEGPVFESVCSTLEYDPDLRDKANHRWFIRERAKFRTVVVMEDEDLVETIHRSFRVTYLRDTLLRPTMDESSLSTLSSLQSFTHADVVKGVMCAPPAAGDANSGTERSGGGDAMTSQDGVGAGTDESRSPGGNASSAGAESGLTAAGSDGKGPRKSKDSYLVQVLRMLGNEIVNIRLMEWMELEAAYHRDQQRSEAQQQQQQQQQQHGGSGGGGSGPSQSSPGGVGRKGKQTSKPSKAREIVLKHQQQRQQQQQQQHETAGGDTPISAQGASLSSTSAGVGSALVSSASSWKQHLAPQDSSLPSRKIRRRGCLSFLRELFNMVRTSLQQSDKDDFYAMIVFMDVELEEESMEADGAGVGGREVSTSDGESGMDTGTADGGTNAARQQQDEQGNASQITNDENAAPPTNASTKNAELQPKQQNAGNTNTSDGTVNLLSLLGGILSDPNTDITERGAALEILSAIAMHDPSHIRRHCLDELASSKEAAERAGLRNEGLLGTTASVAGVGPGRPEPNGRRQVIFECPPNDLLLSLLFLLAVETDAGVLLQTSEIMRIILDTEMMGEQGPMGGGNGGIGCIDDEEEFPGGANAGHVVGGGAGGSSPEGGGGNNSEGGEGGSPGGGGSEQNLFLSMFYEHYVPWLVAPFQYEIVQPRTAFPPSSPAPSNHRRGGRQSSPSSSLPQSSTALLRRRLQQYFFQSKGRQTQRERGGGNTPNNKGAAGDAVVLLLRHVPPCAIRTSFAVELLSFCVRAHCYRMKFFVLRSRVLANVLKLLSVPTSSTGASSGDRCLKLAALRFLRSILSVKDEFYHRHIVQYNLFGPVFEAFRANPVGDNLVSSAIIEMCDFIRVENIKSLVEYIVTKHLANNPATPRTGAASNGLRTVTSLEDVATPYVDTLTLLRKKHEENVSASRGVASAGGGRALESDDGALSNGADGSGGGGHHSRYFHDASSSPGKGPRVGMSEKALEDQRKFRETDEEESYFDADDDDEDHHHQPQALSPRPPSPTPIGPPTTASPTRGSPSRHDDNNVEQQQQQQHPTPPPPAPEESSELQRARQFLGLCPPTPPQQEEDEFELALQRRHAEHGRQSKGGSGGDVGGGSIADRAGDIMEVEGSGCMEEPRQQQQQQRHVSVVGADDKHDGNGASHE